MLFVFTMSNIKTVTVSKVGSSAPTPAPKSITRKVAGFKKHKTHPASSMRKTRKIRAVSNPTQAPPTSPGTIRILTPKGQEMDESKIKEKVDSMSEPEIRKTLAKSGLTLRSKNKHLAKLILGSGMAAGMIPH
jgi:hypothetical protein